MASGKATWQGDHWEIYPDKMPNGSLFERLKTLNDGDTVNVPVEFNFTDKRKARPKQRALFFALLHDIWMWTGEDEEFLKDYFYSRYVIRTNGKTISLANDTANTVSDATFLIDDVVNFIFEFNVPVETGYELLPRDEEYWQYLSIKHRKCLICGKRADIHHVDEIGAGRNRNHIDHTKLRLAALCRVHHEICHKLGPTAFCQKYKLTRLGIRVDAKTLKQIGVKGNYEISKETN